MNVICHYLLSTECRLCIINILYIYIYIYIILIIYVKLFLWLVNFMEQSHFWEAIRSSASPEIPRIVRNPKVHYRIQKHPTPAPILSKIYPVHGSPSYFWKIHFNIIFPSTPVSSLVVSFLYVSPAKPCIHPSSPHTCYMPRPSNLSWFYHPNVIWWGVQIVKLLVM
jgi:hypothetical protein